MHLRLQNYFQTKYFSVILYKLWPWEHFLHCTQFAVGPGANVQMDLQTAPGLKKPGSSQTKSCTISFKFPAFAGSDKRGWWREATGRDCLSKPHLTWARLGLPALLHLLSQFDVHHPPLQFILHILKGSSLPSRFCFMLTRMHVFAIVYNDVQKKRDGEVVRENLAIISWRSQKWRRGNPSLLQLLFDCGKTSKKPVFDQFHLFLSALTFQSIVHYAKRLGVVGAKVRAICTAELLKVAAQNFCQFSTLLAAECAANPKYTDINHFTTRKGRQG